MIAFSAADVPLVPAFWRLIAILPIPPTYRHSITVQCHCYCRGAPEKVGGWPAINRRYSFFSDFCRHPSLVPPAKVV